MQVSVIIPVFNAEAFLEEAVRSAMAQPEVAEILLIEDGSEDESLRICTKLCAADTRVQLLTHPDKKNHGAGASRNLGLLSSTKEFIAFLDADDIYLPLRFLKTHEIFSTHPEADGVYETVGTMYTHEELRTPHLARVRTELTGVSETVAPDSLFRTLATGKRGHIHLDGLVIRKRILNGNINFDPSLRQCQDSDWILRLAAYHTLYSGTPEQPVAMRRVHDENRVFNSSEAVRYQRKYLRKCMLNDFYDSKDLYAKLYIVARYVSWLGDGWLRKPSVLSTPAIAIATALYLVLHPGLFMRIIKTHVSWK